MNIIVHPAIYRRWPRCATALAGVLRIAHGANAASSVGRPAPRSRWPAGVIAFVATIDRFADRRLPAVRLRLMARPACLPGATSAMRAALGGPAPVVVSHGLALPAQAYAPADRISHRLRTLRRG
jgi:hypothetical protein